MILGAHLHDHRVTVESPTVDAAECPACAATEVLRAGKPVVAVVYQPTPRTRGIIAVAGFDDWRAAEAWVAQLAREHRGESVWSIPQALVVDEFGSYDRGRAA